MKRFSWIFTLPITVIVVLFAINNTADTTLSFWPLPWAVSLPVYFIVLSSLFLGFLIGAAIAWASGGKRRRQARQLAEQARTQARQIQELQRQQAETRASASATAAPLIEPSDEHRVARVAAH